MYLPYAVACLWAYSSKDKYISDNYILKEIFVLRDNIRKVVDRIENPYIVGFSCYIWNEKYQLELSKQIKIYNYYYNKPITKKLVSKTY